MLGKTDSPSFDKPLNNPSLEIGGVMVRNPLWLAPLAGITISPVRKFFVFLGAGLVHTEMISCAGLSRGNNKTGNMLEPDPCETPLVLQLFAGDVKTLVEGAEIALQNHSFAALGINMACPMPKVLKKGAGSKLLENPGLAVEMVTQLRKLDYPVWLKIRKTGDLHPLNTLSLCQKLISAGASHITIHGRTPSQRYEGISDRNAIYEAAREFPGFIGASGDVFNPADALDFIDRGCSAVLFARGALRDPFLVPRTLAKMGYNVEERMIYPSLGFQAELLKGMGEDIQNKYNAKIAEILVKRFLSGMFKGIPGVAEFRRQFAMTHGWDNLSHLLDKLQDFLERRDNYEFK